VYQSLDGRHVVRNKAVMELVTPDGVLSIHLLVAASPLDYQSERLAVLVIEDITELMELRAILPICSNCKKIRNEDEYWKNVENYFKESLDVGVRSPKLEVLPRKTSRALAGLGALGF
jgi:hypothetical protein